MFDKKGQSALEYLMTYGWALVVIVIVIAALVILVGTPGGADTCSGSTKFTVASVDDSNSEYGVAGTRDLVVVMTNATGQTISNVDLTPRGVGSARHYGGWTAGLTIQDVNFPDILPASGTYSITIDVTYEDQYSSRLRCYWSRKL